VGSDGRKTRIALLSVASNTTLVVGKLAIGLAIGSVSVLSEAAHSGADLVAACIAFLAVRVSDKPADEDHPFGHGKAENIAGAIEALLIVGAAIWIIIEAVRKLLRPEPLEALGWGVVVMGVSVVANVIVSHMLFKVGKQTDSVALMADGWHLRTDVYTSGGVMGGLLFIEVGKRVFPRYALEWVDPVVAIAVALLILKAGWDLTHQSSRDLVDSRLSVKEEDSIREAIQRFRPAVRGFHHLRTRKAGSHRFVDFHMLVEPTMSVEESHRLTDEVGDEIAGILAGANVNIHVEPCEPACPDDCLLGCMLTADERAAMPGRAQGEIREPTALEEQAEA
jgi:cation diffusion facilitator family transporter